MACERCMIAKVEALRCRTLYRNALTTKLTNRLLQCSLCVTVRSNTLICVTDKRSHAISPAVGPVTRRINQCATACLVMKLSGTGGYSLTPCHCVYRCTFADCGSAALLRQNTGLHVGLRMYVHAAAGSGPVLTYLSCRALLTSGQHVKRLALRLLEVRQDDGTERVMLTLS